VTEATGSETGRTVLGHNSYGKSGVRLVKVKRGAGRHDLWDLDVAVALEGDFEAAYVEGDNAGLLATDTMRNTVYALARDHLTGSIEEFGLALVDHFLEAGPTVDRAEVTITQFPWNRIEVDGRGHEHSFVRASGERTAKVTGAEGGDRSVKAGFDNLLVMKTTQSGWEGFLKERFTTLPDGLWGGVRDRILATFTDHYSPSVQNTLYRIGKAVLEAFPEVEKIRLSFPNKHHIPYDLSRFGMENPNEVFWATDEPYGLIEGTVERKR
jgi:urate oxidase